MFTVEGAFSGFAVRDIAAARSFYGDVLGFTVTENEMGILELHLGSGAHIIAYPKPDHEPAGFTILNLPVPDVDAAVDDLNARGITTKIYDDPRIPTDAKGIMRGIRCFLTTRCAAANRRRGVECAEPPRGRAGIRASLSCRRTRRLP
ncbi:VOC family protein [Microbacterium endophyticum]|uniref:VOC family protein n=1 Tax=Microbacterium endophyticum TaxID=1526412 RepID=UPI0013EA407F|nr:VOC family protein [Microbacterium endophyticum]